MSKITLRTNSERVRPIVKWPGGKARLASSILPLITEHTCYVEPFCGGLGVFTAKPRSKVEVINDLNGDLVNLYRCVKYHAGELEREFDELLNSRLLFRDFLRQPGFTDIQRAARWVYRNALSFGGEGDTWGVQRKSGGGCTTYLPRLLERVRALNSRLEGVNVENLDWQRCVEVYDSPESFFFFDPPYLGGNIRAYAAWSAEQMMELSERLQSLKGRFVVTVNDSKETRSIFKKFKQRSVKRQRCIANKKADERREYAELLVWPRI